MEKDNLDFLLAHILFSIVCAVVFIIPLIQIGLKLLILVIVYNLLIPIIGLFRKNNDWIDIWIFSFFISIFQIFPDWFLSAELNILVFPEDGLFKIGSVSGYMIVLWSIPLFIIMFIGMKVQHHKSERFTYFIVGLISLLIFEIAEQSMWLLGSWYAINVTFIGYSAIYIIIPEIVLGLTCFYAYEWSLEKSILSKICIAFLTMIIYLGNAVWFYFLFEKIIFI